MGHGSCTHFTTTEINVNKPNIYDYGDFFLFFTRGLPFIAHLDSLPNFTRSSDGPVRLPIVDKYKVSSWRPWMLFLKREMCGSLSPPLHCPQQMSGRKNISLVSVHLAKIFLCSLSSLSFSFLLGDFPRAHKHTRTHCSLCVVAAL